LEKKYGLVTAIAMVVGIVIGSGVFFKAEKVLLATGGNLPLGIVAWIIGAFIMICSAYTFAVMATKYVHVNGLVDYAENIMGERYAYLLGWFMSAIYYPTLTGVLAWVSARYVSVLFGFSITGGECMVIACFFLVASYAVNALSPVLAGKFQVSTTVIKLIPLFAMAIIGTIKGLITGMTNYNFSNVVVQGESSGSLFVAVVATAFAYEGWIIATSINAELKDAKKNLPRALMVGTFIIALVYISYYIGLSGTVKNEVLMEGGEAGARLAFSSIFGEAGGTIVFVLIIISCLGTLNGLMLACTRGFYALAARNQGPKAEVFSEIDKVTNMPTNAAIFGLFVASAWLLYFYGANLTAPWFGVFCFDSTELPIVTLYAGYIPMYIMFMKKEKDLNTFKRFIMPTLALCGAIFMVIAAVFSHKMAVVWYLVIFSVIMTVGNHYYKKN
ncbi:MAG: APC family permease, partial [Lachnospiraceae bacterium]|nr:APC family permease [Lachnospiraceae bacterium]